MVLRRTYFRHADIADVSHFVLPETAMDNEAASRGTTVYLVDKRIDMLPALLGTNLCSLRPHVERLAFSVIWVCRSIAPLTSSRDRLSRLLRHTGVDARCSNRKCTLHEVSDCV